jgi:hypothetical protein
MGRLPVQYRINSEAFSACLEDKMLINIVSVLTVTMARDVKKMSDAALALMFFDHRLASLEYLIQVMKFLKLSAND